MIKLIVTSFSLSILLFVASCSSGDKKVSNANDLALPAANGAIGELLLVVDTSHLNGDIGTSLEKVFLTPFPGLPQAEMPFSLTRINYVAFKSLFQRHKTILFAVPFNDGASKGYMERILGKETIDKIRKENKEVHVKNNAFAKNQQMIFVFGDSQQDVANALLKHGSSITEKINRKEEERAQQKIYAISENTKLADILEADYGYNIRIPKDFNLVKGSQEFTWLRLPLEEIDYNILISKAPYSNETQFDSIYISEWRSQLNYNVNGGDTSSVKILQSIYPIESKLYTDPEYMVVDRGLWKLKNNTMGGPFVSYVKASADRKFIYYIEGFVAAPGKEKRELVRELEVILKTFKG